MEVSVASSAIAEFLGGAAVFKKVIDSDLGLAREVEAGFPSTALGHVIDQFGSAIELASVYAVVGNARTLQRKRKGRIRLSRDESDRLARLGRIHQRAIEALGSADKAQRWLTRPNRALEGVAPITVLGSDAGAVVVEQILGRIEHGVFG
jgi:putative toxin-antitoxin system antitoxin component (TIGR02293 family)